MGAVLRIDSNITKEQFSGHTGLTDVYIEDGVTEIGTWAFADCKNLKTIRLPEGIERIPREAFANCGSLVSVKVPDSVLHIDDGAFKECASLENIKFGANLQSIGNKVGTTFDELKWNAVRIISPVGVFKNCKQIKSITLPDSLTIIGDSAFQGCENLNEINIPNGITILGKGTFGSCYKLHEITLPNSLTIIGVYAFGNCNNLQVVNVGNSLTEVQPQAFMNCSNLLSINFPATLKTVGCQAFFRCNKLNRVNFCSVPVLGDHSFQDCSSIDQIILPKSDQVLKRSIFSNCSGLNKEFFLEHIEEFENDYLNSGSSVYQNETFFAFLPFLDGGGKSAFDRYISSHRRPLALKLMSDPKMHEHFIRLSKYLITPQNYEELVNHATKEKLTEITAVLLDWSKDKGSRLNPYKHLSL